jgi:SNF2-related domain
VTAKRVSRAKRTSTARRGGTATATRARSRAAATPTRTATSAMPTIPAGQRLYLLEVPWDLRQTATWAGAAWSDPVRAWTWIGERLPKRLAPFDSPPWSWTRWREDELNGSPRPTPPPPRHQFRLRRHQRDAVEVIASAMRRGRRGVLLADDVGLGKTASGAEAILASDGEVVLICCPLSVIPHWRWTLTAVGTGGKRIVIINWDRLKALLEPPPKALKAKRRRTKNEHTAAEGIPRIRPDMVLADESHNCSNVDSQRTRAFARLNASARFTLYLSATAGQEPLELNYLAGLLAEVTGAPIPTDKKGFISWCQENGFKVGSAGYGKVVWEPNDADIERMRHLLFDPVRDGIPLGLRRLPTDVAGWPEVQRSPLPVELDPAAKLLYASAWTEFRRRMGLATRQQRGNRRAEAAETARVAKLRFRQKCSLLRVPGTVQLAVDLLATGRQAFVSVEFLETVAALRDGLARRGVACSVIDGSVTGTTREAARLVFQHGDTKVMVSTITEGISLHANEQFGGQVLGDAPRTTVIHDVRYTGRAIGQVEGRCNRDGQAAPVLYLYGEGTVEEDVIRIAVQRLRRMKSMHGDSVASLEREMQAVLEQAGSRPT